MCCWCSLYLLSWWLYVVVVIERLQSMKSPIYEREVRQHRIYLEKKERISRPTWIYRFFW
jgi:hypothetical protein